MNRLVMYGLAAVMVALWTTVNTLLFSIALSQTFPLMIGALVMYGTACVLLATEGNE